MELNDWAERGWRRRCIWLSVWVLGPGRRTCWERGVGIELAAWPEAQTWRGWVGPAVGLSSG